MNWQKLAAFGVGAATIVAAAVLVEDATARATLIGAGGALIGYALGRGTGRGNNEQLERTGPR